MADKIRLGIIGANVHRGWAPRSHLPAIVASPEFELTAVCTTRQESAEEAPAHSTIPGTAPGARHSLFDFVDPEHRRRHGFRQRDRLAEILLRFANVLIEQPTGIELE